VGSRGPVIGKSNITSTLSKAVLGVLGWRGKDRELFLQTLGEACAKTDWQIHAWCLMRTIFIWSSRLPKPAWSMA
jgi:hypothetical protein